MISTSLNKSETFARYGLQNHVVQGTNILQYSAIVFIIELSPYAAFM